MTYPHLTWTNKENKFSKNSKKSLWNKQRRFEI